ncbi:NAD-dependent epimerase/dehydratase family protein, partial [Anaerotignum faecicola]|nr:NAD-dependent epimerase/dehydratase family protein [Anaerotignum faecicola]
CLEAFCKDCDFVFNLAGVNRPENPEDFLNGNFGFASRLLEVLKKNKNFCPVMLASSIQAEMINLYGKSKKAGEDLFFSYGKECGADVYIYRFPNVFGKWCRPNYNSVIATFCYNIARELPIQINNPETVLKLVYIDDAISELICAMEKKPFRLNDGFCSVPVEHTATLGEIAEAIFSFR